jgi:HEAT repeat protein
MGSVYQIRDHLLEEIRALKVITGGHSEEKFRKRWIEEVKVATKLSHPYLLRIHDIGQSEALCFLTMEWIEGESFRQKLQREGSFSWSRIQELFFPIAEALAYIHSEKVLHLDIKPENIMIPKKGKSKLVDFGLARAFSAPVLAKLSGAAVGTFGYMAPEQYEGKKVEPASDIFSLAVVLYEALSKELPYGAFEPPEHFCKDLAPPVSAVLLQALKRDPRKRPSLEAFLQILSNDISTLSVRTLEERIQGTQILEDLGKQAITATPQLLETLQDPELQVRASGLHPLGQTRERGAFFSPFLRFSLLLGVLLFTLCFLNGLIPKPKQEALAERLLSQRPVDTSYFGDIQQVHRLPDPEKKRLFAQWIQALKDSDEKKRSAAARLLGLYQVSSAVPALLFLLKDPLLKPRMFAVEALAQLGQKDPRVLSVLLRALHHPQWQIRGGVVEAFARIGSSQAIEPLKARLLIEQEEYVRRDILHTLNQLRDREADFESPQQQGQYRQYR